MIFFLINFTQSTNKLENTNLSTEKIKFSSTYQSQLNSQKSKKKKFKKAANKKLEKKSRTEEKTLNSKSKSNSFTTNKLSNSSVSWPGKNTTILQSAYKALNQTIIAKDFITFKNENKKYDFKMMNKELEDVFHLMLSKDENRQSTNGVRDFIHFFMESYNDCDKDKDNILKLPEFTECIKNDKYLKQIIPSSYSFLNKALFKKYPEDKFYKVLFNDLDNKGSGFINFNEYMMLRLFAFSWKKCSIYSPFLEESEFECALEISANYKTLSRSLSRKVFYQALELSDNQGLRGIDFVSYVNIMQSVRLYSKINSKQNLDITRDEFNNALDTSILPMRYNQKIVSQMLEIMQESDKPNQGIDLLSFIFYDYFLKLFYDTGKKRPYFLNREELRNLFDSPSFPNRTLTEIIAIPQFVFNSESYQTYQYYNISSFNTEENYLYKSFIEVSNSVSEKKMNLRKKNSVENQSGNKVNSKNQMNIKSNFENNKNGWSDFDVELFTNKVANNLNLPTFKGGKNVLNITLNTNITIDKIFDALDNDYDEYIEFKAFVSFIQVVTLFSKEDKYYKGKFTASKLFDWYDNYAEYPVINYKTRDNAKRFNYFEMTQLIDPLDAYLILHIEEAAKYFYRNGETQTVNEIEAKKFLTRMNMKYIPDAYLNKCLRGVDDNNLPKYEWECCFIQGMTLNLKFYEAMDNYLTAKNEKISLSNTVFYNVEKQYQG